VGGKTIRFDFRISQYTTVDEVQKFAQLLRNQGTDALRRALEKEDQGRINVVGSTGNQKLRASATSTLRPSTSAAGNNHSLPCSAEKLRRIGQLP